MLLLLLMMMMIMLMLMLMCVCACVQGVRRAATVRTASPAVTVVTAPNVTQSPANASVHPAGRAMPATRVSYLLTPLSHSLVYCTLVYLLYGCTNRPQYGPCLSVRLSARPWFFSRKRIGVEKLKFV